MKDEDNGKIAFTRILGEQLGDCNNHGDCFHYGSFSGCDTGCPQLKRGECEEWEANIDIIKADEQLALTYKNKLEGLTMSEKQISNEMADRLLPDCSKCEEHKVDDKNIHNSCNSECGYRKKYPVSCQQHECQHLKKK